MSTSVPTVFLIAVLIVAETMPASAGTDKRPSRQPVVTSADTSPAVHREVPDDPWMPRSGTPHAGVIERCEPVVRGPYVSIQVNVDHRGCNIPGDAANEPSIAIDPTDPGKIVIGWRQFDSVESSFRQAGWAYSHDAGHTWVFRGSLTPGVFGSDPVLDADAEGTFYHYGFGSHPNLFRSNDGGVTWDEGVVAPGGDKPWMVIDRTKGIGRGNIYSFWSGAGIEDFSRSTDGGATFDVLRLPSSPGLSWGTMSVGPDGTLYIVRSLGVEVIKSANAQDPDQIPGFDSLGSFLLDGILNVDAPNPGGLLGQASVATDHSDRPTRGNVYVLATVCRSPCLGSDDQADVMFARSTDAGGSWSEPIRVNDDPEGVVVWQWFAMMSVAPNGRIDAVWNDTRSNPGRETANLSELFYAFSTDAGVTWSKNIPVSPLFDSHIGWPQQNKIGDYYHMRSDNLAVNVAYAATFNGEQDVYFLRIGPYDCNANEIPDDDDIADATSIDCNANAVPDECEFRGDFDGDRVTTLADFAAFARCFTGDTVAITAPCCRLFDLDADNDIDVADYTALHRVLTGP